MTMTQGIDYGMGQSNVDRESGIRYGVISQNSINLDCAEWDYDYGKPHCPNCGQEVVDSSSPELFKGMEEEPDWFNGKDWTCLNCEACHWSDSVYPEEALGWSYKQDGYELSDCLDNDIFVLKSPYFTIAEFCSPCVPGAGNLDSPCGAGHPTNEDMPGEDNTRSYCLGPDWFDRHNPMPYRCFRVDNGEEVFEDWVKCDQCQMLSINGIATHETGCPNSRKVWDKRAKEWVEPVDEDAEDHPTCETYEWGGDAGEYERLEGEDEPS